MQRNAECYDQAGSLLLDYNPAWIYCYNRLPIVVGVTLGTFLCLLVTGAVLTYKNRLNLQYRWALRKAIRRRRQLVQPDDAYAYDAFVA